MKYSKIHLGATVRDAETGVIGTLVWLDCHPLDRGALVETDAGTEHAFTRHLELIRPRTERTPVAPERLNRSQTDGWGVVPEYAAVCWLEPHVVAQAA